MNALKTFGLGILWAILFPFILVGVVFVGAFGAIDFIVEFIIMVVNFFRGKKLFPMYPEDQKAYDILQKAIDRQNGLVEATPEPPAPQQVFVQQNFYGGAPVPPGASGALPPGYGQIPPGYVQQPYGAQIPPQQMYPGQLPPQQPYAGQIPQQPYPGQVPNSQPYPEQIPQNPYPQEQQPARPELASLPSFDASEYSQETRTIDIDIDEGGNDHE